MKSFEENVVAVVTKIPEGRVLTYGNVAKMAGSPLASRAVGTIMANNQDKNVPCHRVVKADGGIGAYNGLLGKDKLTLLKKEGVSFTQAGKVLLF